MREYEDPALPKGQHFSHFEMVRPPNKHDVHPIITVLGQTTSAVVSRRFLGDLYLVEIEFEGVKAYSLLTEAELLDHFPRHKSGSTNVLANENRSQHGGKKFRRVLGVAACIPFGMCVPPPHWDILEQDTMIINTKLPILFDAEVLVEWQNGEVTWKRACDTLQEETENDLSYYLAEAGRKNQDNFRRLMKRHYLHVFGLHSNTLDPDTVKGSPLPVWRKAAGY
jgi:hypothetical protein